MKTVAAKREWLFPFAFFPILLIFYPKLFLGLEASLVADHLEQHYPWAWYFWQSLHRGEWPFWTSLVQCGFPIAAEGQIGIFYFPNILLALIFPFKLGYAYRNFLHFFISAAGTYYYARQIKLQPFPAFMAAFIYLFGSAFGGAYYNITSLETLTWLPFILLFFERFLEKGKGSTILWMSLSVSLLLLAGYLQVAILALGIFVFYLVARVYFFSPKEISSDRAILAAISGVILGMLWASPQLCLTFQTAMVSNRVNLSEDYAYVGSMSPLALLTLFFIEFQGFLRGNSLYVGLISIFFILCAFMSKKICRNHGLRIWSAVGIFSFLLAIGQWSPVYPALIKLTHFYAFRTPSKFLVFTCLSFSILCGFGIQSLEIALKSKAEQDFVFKAAKFYTVCLAVAFTAYAIILLSFVWGRPFVKRAGEWLIHHFILGKTGHPHSIEIYDQKLKSFLDSILPILSPRNPWNQWTFFLTVVSLIFMGILIHKKKITRPWLIAACLFLAADLYGFTWRDIRLDFQSYANIVKTSPLVDELINIQKAGRLGRIYGFREAQEKLPLQPSVNMMYGIPDIGIYSPFVLKRYYETIGLFGNVDDSNNALNPTASFLAQHLPILDFLDVSHILSTQPLSVSNFELLRQDDRIFLYANKQPHAVSWFVTQYQVLPDWPSVKQQFLAEGFQPQLVLLLEKNEFEKKLSSIPVSAEEKVQATMSLSKQSNHSAEWDIVTDHAGFFVISNTWDPGWEAKMNGKSVAILRADGLFQAVYIPEPGRYLLSLRYAPFCALVKNWIP